LLFYKHKGTPTPLSMPALRPCYCDIDIPELKKERQMQ
jgi:hypothetical protein